MQYDVAAANHALARYKLGLEQWALEPDVNKRINLAIALGSQCRGLRYINITPLTPGKDREPIRRDVLDASTRASDLAELADDLFHQALEERHSWYRGQSRKS